MHPLVSVVMPIKGSKRGFLDKSIESILHQTLTDLELIVILDRDQKTINAEVISYLEKIATDNRVRIIYNKTNGFVSALNCGIQSARGLYIARMDGDDISLPNRLKKQVESIKKMQVDIIGGWAYVIDEKGMVVGELTPPTGEREIRQSLMLHNPFLHSAMLFKKAVLKRSGLYNIALYGAEDYDLWLRIISLGYKYANLPMHVVMLRETRDSLMRGKQWQATRLNYAKAKALGVARLGYNDPLSITYCLAGPFTLLVEPNFAKKLKFRVGWYRKQSECIFPVHSDELGGEEPNIIRRNFSYNKINRCSK
jgi:glycosyltransferase EpsE